MSVHVRYYLYHLKMGCQGHEVNIFINGQFGGLKPLSQYKWRRIAERYRYGGAKQ